MNPVERAAAAIERCVECVPAPDHINPYRIESQETP